MVDLVPLVLVILGVALALGALTRRWRRTEGRARRGDIVIAAASVVALAGAYLAFRIIDGDPDVWDFYASVWWVPLVIGSAVALVAAAALRPHRARADAVGSRAASSRR